MKMDQWNVLESLKQITDLDEEGATAALPLCHSGLEEIKVRLRDDADPNDPRVISAAAALAFYKMTLRRIDSNEAVTSFKAGDVTVTKSPSAMLEGAVKIRDDALINILPLVKDEGFIFMRVGGEQ